MQTTVLLFCNCLHVPLKYFGLDVIIYMMLVVFGIVVIVASVMIYILVVLQPIVLLIGLVTTMVIMKHILVFLPTYIIEYFTSVPTIVWFVRFI